MSLTWNGKDRYSTLDDRIGRAGILIFDDAEGEHCSDPVAAQLFIDAFTLDDARAEVKAKISAHAYTLRNRVISGISAGEMASWPIKLAEARAFAEGATAEQCPMLSSEAAARGVTLAELVSKVSSNATTFAGLEATIAGVDGKHRDAIAALNTFQDIADYNWLTGWPEV